MRVQFLVETRPLAKAVERCRRLQVPAARGRKTVELTRRALLRTIARHPVRTGRSRAAWIAALHQLGDAGPAPRAGGGPVAEGARAGQVERHTGPQATQIDVRNRIPYVVYLEYGTRHMAPRAMVRQSLAEVQQELRHEPLTLV